LDDGALDTMEIAFKTKALRTLCLTANAMDERYGDEDGMELRRWLADMSAAERLTDVPLLTLSSVYRNCGGKVAVNVGVSLVVVFMANHQKPPKLADGAIDWSNIDRILVCQIEQTHG